MGWKNWPYWVRGGIIGILLIICIIIIHFGLRLLADEYLVEIYPGRGILEYNNFGKLLRGIGNILGKVFTFPSAQILYILFPCSPTDFGCFSLIYLVIPLMIIQYFLIGSVLGWLYGKIKNRNQPQQVNPKNNLLKSER